MSMDNKTHSRGIFRYEIFDTRGIPEIRIVGVRAKNTRKEKVEIPEEINGVPVVVIGVEAFSMCLIDEVVISKNIEMIASKSFNMCGIKKLTFASRVNTRLKLAGECFSANKLTSVDFPTDVKLTIGNGAFSVNEIFRLNIPNGCTEIGMGAFANNNLAGVDFDANCQIIRIEMSAFKKNVFKSIVLPNSVTYINLFAFDDGVVIIGNENIYADGYGSQIRQEPILVGVKDTTSFLGDKAYWIDDIMQDEGLSVMSDRNNKIKAIYGLSGQTNIILGNYIEQQIKKIEDDM